MKILLVAGYFPPYAPVSATRVNKLAKYLLERGHDVRVLAPKNAGFPAVMQPEIPAERVIFTPVFEVLEVPGRLKATLKAWLGKPPASTPIASSPGAEGSSSSPVRQPWWARLSAFYAAIVSTPDSRIGWYGHAVRAGRALFARWRPDIIYASAPPHTGLLVASRLARLSGAPWVCEYRDLWVDHPYYDGGSVRRWIESRLENRTLNGAAGLVTVTRTWADWLAKKHRQPVEFVMNGYDPADYPDEAIEPLDRERLTIIYTGGIYPGKRDPAALFAALALMGDEARRVRVIFHMPEALELVRQLAAAHGVTDSVEVSGLIPRKEAIRRQRGADLLLLLRWDDPREDSVLAGKLFEYIGARRPILSVGSETGEAAEIIRDQGFGVVANNPQAIADALRAWLPQKRGGLIPAPAGDMESFARPRQFARLENFLEKLISSRSGA
ncbi:MAG: glycosyltransferase [Sphingomonadales bacterium]|nr:glycosyltransferase [Sphingomonadales bacterium]